VTAGGDRARDAPDRELAVDLYAAVIGETNRRRAERDLGMVLGVEELRPEHCVLMAAGSTTEMDGEN
jgi:hypothetical protein